MWFTPIYVVIIIPLLVCWLFCKLNKLFRKWRIIGFKPMFSEGNKIKKEKEVFLATQSEIMRSHRFESCPVRIPLMRFMWLDIVARRAVTFGSSEMQPVILDHQGSKAGHGWGGQITKRTFWDSKFNSDLSRSNRFLQSWWLLYQLHPNR